MHNLEHSLELGTTCPIYLFYGEETLLMEQAAERLVRLVVPDGSLWNIETLRGDEAAAAEVAERAQSGAFLAGRKIIVVRNVSWFKSKRKARGGAAEDREADEAAEDGAKQDLEPLIAYAKDPNPSTVLVLMADNGVNKNSRLVKAIAAAGRVVEFVSPQGGEREMWLNNYLRAAGKQPERGVAGYLSMMCGEGLRELAAEADKLLLYCADQSGVSLADAEAVASRGSLAGVFELTDAVAQGDAPAAVQTLRRLLRQGEAPQMMIGMLASQYRTILAAKDMSERGFATARIAAKLGVNPYYAKRCAAAGKRRTFRQLLKTLDILLAVDIDSKSGQGDAAELLEVAVLRICAL